MIIITIIIIFTIVVFLASISYPSTFNTIKIAIYHCGITAPSLLYHGLPLKFIRPKYISNTPLVNKNVIVFVHGRNGWHSDFDALIVNLKLLLPNNLSENNILISEKKYALRSINLGETGYTSIEEDAKRLKTELKIYENCKIVLIGLSKGGLTIMKYATKYNDARLIKLITISSPLKGTQIVSLLFSQKSSVFESLSFNNSIVNQIIKDKQNLNVPIYHIVPTFDHLIIPTSSAKYDDTPDENIYYYDGYYYSHAGICFNIDVAKSIIKWIQS